MLCIGHRGARGHEPENTLRSIRKAFELGADGVEIDVWLVEGELVVIHDSRLERTTNGHGVVGRKSLAELRTLDAGLGEKIPVLSEVFAEAAGRGFVNVELKGPGTAEPVAALIESFVQKGLGRTEDFLVSSFSLRQLRRIRDRGLRLGLLYSRPSPLYYLSARHLSAVAVHPSARFTSKRLVEDAHRRGLQVYPYTVNTPAELERMRQLGVDGVFTDFPDRCVERS